MLINNIMYRANLKIFVLCATKIAWEWAKLEAKFLFFW